MICFYYVLAFVQLALLCSCCAGSILECKAIYARRTAHYSIYFPFIVQITTFGEYRKHYTGRAACECERAGARARIERKKQHMVPCQAFAHSLSADEKS